MANNVVNNQEHRGYEDGNQDGLRGNRFSYHSSKWSNWSKYAIDTYKKGYKLGYKSGQISKKQNDHRSRQMQYKKNTNITHRKNTKPIQNPVEDSGCVALVFALFSSFITFIILIINLI